MVNLLINLFIKDKNNTQDQSVREAYGMLCGSTGILLNILLFALKLAAGLLSGSIAITADALNNLSDAGSSVITMAGIKLAGKKPDSGHPFGHGRMEYISGLFVAVIILIMSFELIKSSIENIITPKAVETSWWVIAILIISISVKVYMWFYNKKYGKMIDSSAMLATATDSLNDTVSTGAVLITTLIVRFADVNLDAYCGLMVGLFVLYSGVKTMMDTIGEIMGKAPDKESVEDIRRMVLSHEGILGVHDMLIHDYGPGRKIISLHAEVPADGDILEMHDLIDNIERELREKLKCDATIHMDPVMNDEETLYLKIKTADIIHRIDPSLTIHDFRTVKGPTHKNLIFDVVVPHNYHVTNERLKSIIGEAVAREEENCFVVINIDNDYLGVQE